jgi:DNA adenine methylase
MLMKKINNSGVPTFVKWAGGKTQLLSQFEPLIPDDFNSYVEPFIGSGAMFFFMKKNFELDNIIISDNNEELINVYKTVQNNLDELFVLLQEHKINHSKEYYYETRSTLVEELSPLERAARFLYLNKTCFNGLYRVNSKGLFNVPIGSYKNPNIVNEKNLREANELLDGVTIKLHDFENSLEYVKSGDFVYFDPPYYPLSKTANFTSYTKNVFLDEEQNKLADVYHEMDQLDCKLMLSNSDTPFIHNLYSGNGYRVKKVQARRMINSNASKRGAIDEVLVMNYNK